MVSVIRNRVPSSPTSPPNPRGRIRLQARGGGGSREIRRNREVWLPRHDSLRPEGVKGKECPGTGRAKQSAIEARQPPLKSSPKGRKAKGAEETGTNGKVLRRSFSNGSSGGLHGHNRGSLQLALHMRRSRLQRHTHICLLYTSPSPRDGLLSRMPSSA